MASSNQSLDTLIGNISLKFKKLNHLLMYCFGIKVKATNPLVDCPDPIDVALFCEKVTHEHDGIQIATRLLAYRIHSPQEKEALHALAVSHTF